MGESSFVHTSAVIQPAFSGKFAPMLAQSNSIFPFGLGGMNSRLHPIGISIALACPGLSRARVGASVVARQTLRSSRTPPALPSALSQFFAISAPLSASVQAWPLSFIR